MEITINHKCDVSEGCQTAGNKKIYIDNHEKRKCVLYLKHKYFKVQHANINDNKVVHQRFAFSPRQFLLCNESPASGLWFCMGVL